MYWSTNNYVRNVVSLFFFLKKGFFLKSYSKNIHIDSNKWVLDNTGALDSPLYCSGYMLAAVPILGSPTSDVSLL